MCFNRGVAAGIHHSKYWMPIHYDTIEDGQNKTSHRLFSNSTFSQIWQIWNNIGNYKIHLISNA